MNEDIIEKTIVKCNLTTNVIDIEGQHEVLLLTIYKIVDSNSYRGFWD